MSERFNKYGIKLIAADVGMSNYYTKGESGRGGVKTDIRGNIRAQSKEGVHNLYDALKIKEGDFIMFPSLISHQVGMNETKDKERISLALDTFPTHLPSLYPPFKI